MERTKGGLPDDDDWWDNSMDAKILFERCTQVEKAVTKYFGLPVQDEILEQVVELMRDQSILFTTLAPEELAGIVYIRFRTANK
jgi:hypothetical protein